MPFQTSIARGSMRLGRRHGHGRVGMIVIVVSAERKPWRGDGERQAEGDPYDGTRGRLAGEKRWTHGGNERGFGA